jgi:hypothetical protein
MINELLDFIISSSLFLDFKIENDLELKELVRICNKEDRFELFCPGCGDKKVFMYDGGFSDIIVKNIWNSLHSTGSIMNPSYTKYDPLENVDHMYFRFKCSFNESHKLEYFFVKRGSQIIKVGQYPSSADIDLPQASRYSAILGKQYYNELKRALGLHSHGVGIGSFVYLRRIIEKLVHDTFKEAETAEKLTRQEFEFQADGKNRNTMEAKIKLLKGFLPDLITDHPKIYGVVSKGIHELTEEECLEYFPVLKDGIVMILDDIVTKKEKEKAAEEYKKSLGKIISDLK